MDEEIKDGEQPSFLEDGSPVGRFSDAKTLLDAYNNLQAEFTKKCQKLSDLVKEKEDQAAMKEQEQIPQYKKEGWQQKVEQFVSDNKYASTYINEIADMLINDVDLSLQDNCLNLAYQKVLASHFQTPDEIVSTGDFIDKYVLSNEDIKMRIITDYLHQLNSLTVPTVISTQKGSSNISSNTKPKTLAEASAMATILFKQ